MERRLAGRRSSSKLPALIALVMSRPLVSAGMIAKQLAVTPRSALRIVEELGLREMTGRGRFRPWGIFERYAGLIPRTSRYSGRESWTRFTRSLRCPIETAPSSVINVSVSSSKALKSSNFQSE
jgi:hypothetical protein